MSSRTLHKSWQNKRPGWTRRIRWLEALTGYDIRLDLEDETGRWNIYPTSPAEAQDIFDRFRNGEAVGREW